ncbi:hypothetical protein Tco_1008004, partial [Tanacetum coccineum]
NAPQKDLSTLKQPAHDSIYIRNIDVESVTCSSGSTRLLATMENVQYQWNTGEMRSLVAQENICEKIPKNWQPCMPHSGADSEKMMEVFIGGLPRSIEGNVTASKPQTLEKLHYISQRAAGVMDHRYRASRGRFPNAAGMVIVTDRKI